MGAQVTTLVGGRFATAFDEPALAERLPVAVAGGQDSALRLVDRFVRGVRVVGRFAATPGMLGVVAEAAEQRPVWVRLRLRLDATAMRWWLDRVPAGSTPTADAAGREALARQPRLAAVWSQGRLRQAVLICPEVTPSGEFGEAVAEVAFSLEPGEVGPGGLVVVELGELPVLPAAVAGRVAPAGIVGLQVDLIEVGVVADRAAGSDTAGLVSVGDLPRDVRRARQVRCGLVVVNPAPAGGHVRLRLRVAWTPGSARRPGMLRRGWHRVRGGARARWTRWVTQPGSPHRAHAAGATWVPTPTVDAVRIADGKPVDTVVVRCLDGQIDVTVPAGDGSPVLLVVAAPRRGPGPGTGRPVWRLTNVVVLEREVGDVTVAVAGQRAGRRAGE